MKQNITSHKEIKDIKSKYYALLWKQRPMVKIWGDVKFDWAWRIMDKVLKGVKEV